MVNIEPCWLNQCGLLSEEYIRDIVVARYNIKSFSTDDAGGLSVKIDGSRLFHFFCHSGRNVVLLLFDLITEHALIDGDASRINDLLQCKESTAQLKINFGEDNRLNIYQLIDIEHVQEEVLFNTIDDFLSLCHQVCKLFCQQR